MASSADINVGRVSSLRSLVSTGADVGSTLSLKRAITPSGAMLSGATRSGTENWGAEAAGEEEKAVGEEDDVSVIGASAASKKGESSKGDCQSEAVS